MIKVYNLDDQQAATALEIQERKFRNLGEMSPQRKLYVLYLERIEIFRSEPPGDDWDGVYTHTTK